ncbi:MAG TPA: TadE family protein [Terracidiphilus sp.]
MRTAWREQGGSVVELALVMGILGPVLLVGTTELSLYVYASVELTDATHAAASFASQYYFENSNSILPTQTQVTAAATNDAPELVSLLKSGSTFTATMATGCGTGAATNGNTLPTCATGTLPYVQVTGSANVAPIVSFLSGTSIAMTSRARVNLVK